MFKSINIRQINMNKSKNAHSELERLLFDKKKTIVLVQEPALCRGKVLGLANFKTEAISDKARAAILISRDIDATPVAMFIDQDLVLCQIKTNNGGLLIGSVYCDILVKDFSLIDKAAKYAVKCDKKLVLGADSNAWSTLWGDRSNARGRELEETIVSNGLSIENKRQSIPTFEGGMGSSFIDLTLTHDMHDKIKNWSVVRSVDSDHNYICYDVVEEVELKTKIAWGKTDWKGFRGDLDLVQWNLPPQWTARTIDTLQQDITTQVNKCFEKYAKRVPVSYFRDNNYWQDEQTKAFIRKKTKAFRAYTQNPTEETKRAFQVSRDRLGNRIRKFKRER